MNPAAAFVLRNSVREVRAARLGGVISFKKLEVNTPVGKPA
jgi:hypothetical protein